MTQPDITNSTGRRDQYLTIRQQNVNRSLIAQSDFLYQLDLDVYDFAAIQESYLDSNHNSCATHHWYTVYPKEHYVTPTQTRSIILVNRWLALESWSQVDIGSSDVTALVSGFTPHKIISSELKSDQPS